MVVFHTDNFISFLSHLKSYSLYRHWTSRRDTRWERGGTSTALESTFPCFRYTHKQNCFTIRISAPVSIGTAPESTTPSA